MKKLNNKGYMLVEIILAFAITFALVYFIMDIVIDLKNKNDDLLVETVIRTDQTIITNKLMDYAMSEMENEEEEDQFNCNELKIDGQIVKYRDEVIDIVDDMAVIDTSNVSCSTDYGKVSIVIPISVEQMKDEDFDVVIDYKYDIGDMVAPTCSLSVSGTTITATATDNDGGSGLDYDTMSIENEEWTSSGDNTYTMKITDVGDYIYEAIDKGKNINSCKVSVVKTTKKVTTTYSCGDYYTDSSGNCYYDSTSHDETCVGASSCIQTVTSQTVPCCQTGYSLNSSMTQCCKTTTSTTRKYVSKTASTTTTYTCDEDDGYTKINDSYCYKLGDNS